MPPGYYHLHVTAAQLQEAINAPHEPYRFSPSQVETFLSCRRKWAWRVIARIKTSDGESAKLGSDVHAELERYLAGGSLDYTHPKGAGYIAASGLHLIPEPNAPGMLIESSFDFLSPRGWVWNGRKDLELDDSGVIPNLAEDNDLPADDDGHTGVPAILDHKSTGSLRWAKTPEDLTWDVQANVYAYALMRKRSVPTVDLAWVYYQTKGAKASKRVHLRVHQPHAERAFGLIEDIAAEMAAYLDAALPPDEGPLDARAFVRTMPPNPSACNSYGGCPYQHVCQLSIAERMRANMSGGDWLDSLKKRAEEQDGHAAPSTMGCAPTDVPAPSGIPAWLLGNVAPSTPAGLSTDQLIKMAAPEADSEALKAKAQLALADINPPEATAALAMPVALPPAPTPPAANEPKKRGGGGRPKGSKNKPKAELVDDGSTDNAPAIQRMLDAAAADVPAEDKDCTYPIGDTTCALKGDHKVHYSPEALAALANVDAETNMGEGVPPSNIELPTAPIVNISIQQTAHAAPMLESKAIGTLYLDCFPVGAGATMVEKYIAKANEAIRDQGYEDYRFAEYGQGAGMLASATLAAVLADPPAELVVSTRTPEGSIVATKLIANATRVVRGMG